MEVTARLRYVQGSAQKMRLVADLIRGKGVQEAVNLLGVTNKAAARHVQKCLKSAIANAENREDHVDVDRLFVKEIFVDGGPMAKRIRPAPMGRAFRILKRQSHLTIKLDTRKGPEPGSKSTRSPRRPASAAPARKSPAPKSSKA
jgi:large subunit ribosomal protein L22